MSRPTTRTVIVLLITTLWLSGNAIAFTLRLGSMPQPHAASALPVAEASDLPTPQLFRVAIGAQGVTLDAPHPSEGYTSSRPEIRYQEVQASAATGAQASQRASTLPTQSRLSGAELLLLRNTQVVADSQHK